MTVQRMIRAMAIAVAIFGCVDPYDVVTQVVPDSEIRVADEPIAVIGQLEGPDEYLLDNVAGALRLG